MIKALIDDIVLYKAVCSAVTKQWSYVSEEGDIAEIESWREGQKIVKEHGGELVFKEEDRGIKACIMAFNQILNRIKRETKCTEYVILLSSRTDKCYRYKIAKTKPYKGQRPAKPKYYDEMYEEVIKSYPHMISRKGREVDDELGIIQTEAIRDGGLQTIICTSDKDLLQIPGRHYNLDTRKLFKVDREGFLTEVKGKVKGTGLKWFYAQMLLGDSADNIPGIPAKGVLGDAKLKAQRILDGLGGSLSQCEQFVTLCYREHYGEEAIIKMLEVGRLLRILTCEDKALWELEYELD